VYKRQVPLFKLLDLQHQRHRQDLLLGLLPGLLLHLG